MASPETIHCLGCGYDLRGLTENRCPECGRPFDPDDPGTYDCGQRFRRNPLVGACIGASGPFLIAIAILLRAAPLALPAVTELLVCWLVVCWLIAAASLSANVANLRVAYYPKQTAAWIAVAIDAATLSTLLGTIGWMMSELLGIL
jgi:hypothetical protein